MCIRDRGCADGETMPCYGGEPGTAGVGVCTEGTQTCDGGSFGPCLGQIVPLAEVCNGADDDCNGEIDDAGTVTCGLGACEVTVAACDGGQPAVCTPLNPAPVEACDGLDDDCDGVVDDGCPCSGTDTQGCYSGPSGALGVGECVAGTQSCSGGSWGACSGDVLPAAEQCNGQDDDCDGDVDEGCACNDGATQACYTGPMGTAGIGECVSGTQTCSGGAWGPCGGSVAPVAELCNGLDDDCDGTADQGDPEGGQACNTGLSGVCDAGLTSCNNGQLDCVQSVMSSMEVCDGLDNDCDGTPDEGNPAGGQPCSTGLMGVCGQGTSSCSGGMMACNQTTASSPEVCDGLDNDCDGSSDEGNPGGGQLCNTGQPGVCADGATGCLGGQIQCSPLSSPSSEVCDGLDNDCDGTPDDGNPGGGMACATGGLGVCAAGTTSCTNGSVSCIQNVQPSAETCDGVDNDCNGASDDGNPGGGVSCNTGQPGICAAGTTSCSGGQIQCNQNVSATIETCNGLDDDCDGTPDDGNPSGGQSCVTGQLGVCSPGTTSCTNGAVVCNQNVQPSAEVCDGADNDCDGVPDDGDPGGGLACNTGQPGVCASGTTTCSGGQVTCAPNTPASAETCDGLDNDCDGTADDGNPGGGLSCNTGQPGVCGAGTTACSNGVMVCNQNTMAGAETCDGLDNDCDGAIDDGDPGGGAACNTGLNGVCAAGTIHCVNGALVCTQDIVAGPEICSNGLDDNCDGVTDENPDWDGDGWGKCDGDCCEGNSFCSGSPELVNPGAFEFVGNGIDDDCDPATSDSVAAPACSSVADFSGVTGTQLAEAMELCQFTTANPPLPQRKWGVISAEQVFADGSSPNGTQLGNIRNWQSAVVVDYGSNVAPQMGPTMAAISTGRMRDQGDPGFVNPDGGTDFGHSGNPPPVYLAGNGGSLPASASCNGNCPAGGGANDSVNARLTIRVPTNALSFSYKFKFYTAEFPEWTCTIYNDFYLALLQTGAPGVPADTNISFDAQNNPVSVNNGFFDVCQAAGCYSCPAGTSELVGTGMQGGIGGGTEWLFTTAPVVAGETIVLELMVFDVSDGVWDSLVLLDDFQWAIDPADVGTGVVGG